MNMNETFAYEIKTYVAIWFDYIWGKYYIRHTEIIEAHSYSVAFGMARIINKDLNLYDHRVVVQRIDLSKIRPF